MDDKKQPYIWHEGSGTLIALSECVIVELDDATADAVADGAQDDGKKLTGQQVDNPWMVVSFTGPALREHFENYDEADFIEGLTDADLTEAGEWAIDSAFMWDGVHDAWRYGVEQVKAEREAGLDGPI